MELEIYNSQKQKIYPLRILLKKLIGKKHEPIFID